MTTRLPVFDDVSGVKTAVNPSKVITVSRTSEQYVDIFLDNGAVVRVELAFEKVLAKLEGLPEVAQN